MVRKIPEGSHTITPNLIVKDAAKAIELYKKAFGAKELYRVDGPGGKIMHAAIQIGDSQLFLADVMPGMSAECATPSVSSFYLYFEDVDAMFKQAKQAGLSETHAVQDMFYGDRVGSVKDLFGIQWTLATHVRDVSPEEMEEGKKKMLSKAA